MPPPAQGHGQLVHAAQQVVDLRPQLPPPSLGGRPGRRRPLVGQPLAAADGRRVELGVRAEALGRELHEDRLRVADLAPAAGSPGRWRSAPAAWAARGRAGRRWCRGGGPRGPGPSAAGRNATRRRCVRPAANARCRSRSSEIASSKSRASTGSMVTTVSAGQVEPAVQRLVERFGLAAGPLPGRPRRTARAG